MSETKIEIESPLLGSWRMRNKKDDPWLSDKEIRQVNFLYTPPGIKFTKSFRDYQAMSPLLDNKEYIKWIEPILKHKYLFPLEPFECQRGGWCPFGEKVINGSQTADDVGYRLECRENGDLKTADLIREVCRGGQVELRDFKEGTMWIFEWCFCYEKYRSKNSPV